MTDKYNQVDDAGTEKKIKVDGLEVQGYDPEEQIKREKYLRKKALLQDGKLPCLTFGIRLPGGPGL